MQNIVEKTRQVNEQIDVIANSIDNAAEVLEGMAKRIGEIGDFATSTSATSEECVSLSNELYEQVNRMNEMIEQFKVNS